MVGISHKQHERCPLALDLVWECSLWRPFSFGDAWCGEARGTYAQIPWKVMNSHGHQQSFCQLLIVVLNRWTKGSFVPVSVTQRLVRQGLHPHGGLACRRLLEAVGRLDGQDRWRDC